MHNTIILAFVLASGVAQPAEVAEPLAWLRISLLVATVGTVAVRL
jgi:hypothetical protein